jgi:hypothetical protein
VRLKRRVRNQVDVVLELRMVTLLVRCCFIRESDIFKFCFTGCGLQSTQ